MVRCANHSVYSGMTISTLVGPCLCIPIDHQNLFFPIYATDVIFMEYGPFPFILLLSPDFFSPSSTRLICGWQLEKALAHPAISTGGTLFLLTFMLFFSFRNPGGIMYSADADGCGRMRTDADGRGRTRTDADGRGRTRTDADGRGRTRTDADGRGRTRTDADGRGRTRTDADGRGRTRTFYFYFKFFIFFWAYIYLRAQLERDPESDRLRPPHQLANYMSTMHRYRDGSVQEQVNYISIIFYRYRWIIE